MLKSYCRVLNVGLLLILLSGCGAASTPYHGFTTASGLDNADSYVLAESVGGKLDPQLLSKDDQRYTHGGIAYDRMEEGYYQWGVKVFDLGYRDEMYVRDLAPRAFKRDILDIYDKALQAGFEDEQDHAKQRSSN